MVATITYYLQAEGEVYYFYETIVSRHQYYVAEKHKNFVLFVFLLLIHTTYTSTVSAGTPVQNGFTKLLPGPAYKAHPLPPDVISIYHCLVAVILLSILQPY